MTVQERVETIPYDCLVIRIEDKVSEGEFLTYIGFGVTDSKQLQDWPGHRRTLFGTVETEQINEILHQLFIAFLEPIYHTIGRTNYVIVGQC